jgi:hypothetical protein
MSKELVDELISGVVLPPVETPTASAASQAGTGTPSEPQQQSPEPEIDADATGFEADPEMVEAEPEEQRPAASPAKAPGQDAVPLASHVAMRHRLQRENEDLRIRLAVLEQRDKIMPAVQAQATQPVQAEEDPAEVYVREYVKENGGNPGDVMVPHGVLKASREWESRQSQAQQAAQVEMSARTALNSAQVAWTDDVLGEGLGFTRIAALGNQLLDAGDRLMIAQSGPEAARVTYNRCLKKLIESGSPAGQDIYARLVARQQKPAPKPAGQQQEGGTSPLGTPKQSAPTRQEILNRHPMMASLGLSMA